MKLEEQKSDLERQLKTLTKQIKVRRGYRRGQGAFSFIVLRVSLPSVWNPLKNTPLTLLACFSVPSCGPWNHRLVLAGNKIKPAFQPQDKLR